MPDPQTANLGLYIPLNGADVGAWDVPMNQNFNLLDTVSGGVATVALTNVNVTLSPAQYNCNFIIFTGALSGNLSVIFPAVGRTWIVLNNCTNVGTNYFLCQGAGTQWASPPPGEPVMIISDGTDIRFVGLGRIGSYWDFAGTTVPLWVSQSVPVPYLNCNGTAFSSATYPNLRDYLGTNVLPDARGRFRATLNQTTGRLTGASGTNGLDGNTLLSGGGNQTFGQTNMPNYALTVTDPGHGHTVSDPGHGHAVTDPSHIHGYNNSLVTFDLGGAGTIAAGATQGYNVNGVTAAAVTGISINANVTGIGLNAAVTGISVNTGGSANAYAPPSYVGGLTLIRAG